MTDKIKILLVDDHAMFRAGIRALIEAEQRMKVVGEASSGDEAVDRARELKPDVVIMDLEGQQGVPLAEARRKSSPLRDVASMLRSFDYARRTAVNQTTQHEGDLERMAPAADAWLEATRQTFLAAYAEQAVDAGLYPDLAAFEEEAPLIALFELQKALEELRFELDNRPELVGIPLRGLTAMAQ